MWSSLLPVFVTTALLLFAPGLLIGLVAGLRPVLALALAPALCIAAVAGTGVVAPWLHLAWGPVTVGLTFLVLLALAFLLRRLPAPRSRTRHRTDDDLRPATAASWLTAWAVAAAVTGLSLCRMFNTPNAFSQTYDAVFHLNAVQWIRQTGNASSLNFLMEAPDGSIYPVGWHTLVALGMRLSGTDDIPLATNAAALAVASLVWTAGCLALTHIVLRGRPVALLTAAVMTGSFAAFPFLLLNWGVLYSNFMAVCLLPALAAATVALLPLDDDFVPGDPLLPVTVAAAAGLGLSQPNTVTTLLIFVTVVIVARFAHAHALPEEQRPANIRGRAVAALAACAVLLASWCLLRPPSFAAIWGPSYPASGAIGEVMTTTTAPSHPMIWIVSILTLIGIVAALRTPRYRWLAATHLILCLLYVVARSTPTGDLRFSLVGVWYNDTNRLAAQVPLTAVPLAALGALAVVQWCRVQSAPDGVLRRRAQAVRAWTAGRTGLWVPLRRIVDAVARVRPTARWRWTAYTLLVLVLVYTGPLSAAMSQSIRVMQETYEINDGSLALTPDEYDLITELPDLVDEGATVAVDPRSGAALAYAISGVDTTAKHLLQREDPNLKIVEARLYKATTDPRICPALESLNATYTLYFPGRTISNQAPYPGFTSLNTAPGFELVAKKGRVALYRITACE